MFIKIFTTFLCFFYVGALYSETILIKNATIYDGVKNIPFEGNILIENETIKQVSSTNMQADFVIDASGMIVTPGIIGTDTNIGIVEIGALSVTRDDSSEIYSIGFSIHDAFNPKSTLIPWNRSNGVTSALSLPQGTSSPIGGLGLYFSFNSINLRISEALCVLIINGKLSLVNLKRALTSLGCSSINSAIGEASINSAISASEDKSLIFIDDAKESKSSIIA